MQRGRMLSLREGFCTGSRLACYNKKDEWFQIVDRSSSPFQRGSEEVGRRNGKVRVVQEEDKFYKFWAEERRKRVSQHRHRCFKVLFGQKRPLTFVTTSKANFHKEICVVANTKENKGFKNQNSNSKKVCTQCGRFGHTIDICYKKHDYRHNHKLHRKSSQVNHALTQEDDTDKTQHVEPSGDFRLTPQQYQILANLFKNSTPANINQLGFISSTQSSGNMNSIFNFAHNKPIWILDSSDTYHVCISLQNFSNYTIIKPIQITLPNGTMVYAEYSRNVVFSPNLYLTKVLYVLQVIKTLNCISLFLLMVVSYKTLKTKETIGLVKNEVGLYLYKSANKPIINSHHVSLNNCNIKNINIWHSRLGHLSNEILCIMSTKYDYIIFHNFFH